MHNEITTLVIFEGIIAIVAIITFFLMAYNVSQLKKFFLPPPTQELHTRLGKAEIMDDKPQIISLSLEISYRYLNEDYSSDKYKATYIKKYLDKVSINGGTVPKYFIDFMANNYSETEIPNK